ncbi:Uncharacterized protein FWK35_00010295 [Aphis craccivora]|uniref:Uncharacterized protein n=1 Tax=Aphis craccivora TaxID=307492 RepID=A0A6G0YGK9_APHCR|nr:Uncharacterized protein FWK35_00010295 [Aphis craccivora]
MLHMKSKIHPKFNENVEYFSDYWQYSTNYEFPKNNSHYDTSNETQEQSQNTENSINSIKNNTDDNLQVVREQLNFKTTFIENIAINSSCSSEYKIRVVLWYYKYLIILVLKQLSAKKSNEIQEPLSVKNSSCNIINSSIQSDNTYDQLFHNNKPNIVITRSMQLFKTKSPSKSNPNDITQKLFRLGSSRFSCCSDRLFFPSQLSQHIIVTNFASVIKYLLMSSSSGGDLRACKSPAPNKIKPSLTTNRTSDSSFTTVISRKNLRKLNSNLLTPPSPGLQQIINNTPILNTSQSAFNYITDNNSSADPVINNGLSTDNLNDSTSNSLPDVNSTQINTSILSTDLPNDINMSSQYIQQTFSPDYNGPVVPKDAFSETRCYTHSCILIAAI